MFHRLIRNRQLVLPRLQLLQRSLQLIRDKGCKAGLVFNPATPLNWLDYVLDKVDMVLIMSVNPGFGGQKFIPNTLTRIRQLREMLNARGLNPLIEIDGGVNTGTIAEIAAAGVDVFVAGSAIFGSPDYRATIAAFRRLIGESTDAP